MSTTNYDLMNTAFRGLRVVGAVEAVLAELGNDSEDPAVLVLSDLRARHAEQAERAARSLRVRLRLAYQEEEEKGGES